jgi:formate C-acetyltransferase
LLGHDSLLPECKEGITLPLYPIFLEIISGRITSSGSPTSLSNAVVSVQCGYGNTIPLQLDMDPGLGNGEHEREMIQALIRSHFDQGGTLINLNVLDREQILRAHEDPSLYPDLIVRVTGFSAYFASLSRDFRQLVVDRIVTGV